MRESVHADITPTAAAKLVFTNDIALNQSWLYAQSISVLEAIYQLPVKIIIALIDQTEDRIVGTNEIPQFGKIETLIRVSQICKEKGIEINHAQLGLWLTMNPDSSSVALAKYGETHAKGAGLIGIVTYDDCMVKLSALTNAFCDLPSGQQRLLVIKLLLRISIVQVILKKAANGKYNGYDSMADLSVNTKKRRSSCLRGILQLLEELNDRALNDRINNIYWELGEDCDEQIEV